MNSVGHHFGRKPYENTATNLQWLAFLTAGEGLHNNHHAAPTSAKLALRRPEIDPAWWFIATFRQAGLGHDPPRQGRPRAASPASRTGRLISRGRHRRGARRHARGSVGPSDRRRRRVDRCDHRRRRDHRTCARRDARPGLRRHPGQRDRRHRRRACGRRRLGSSRRAAHRARHDVVVPDARDGAA